MPSVELPSMTMYSIFLKDCERRESMVWGRVEELLKEAVITVIFIDRNQNEDLIILNSV